MNTQEAQRLFMRSMTNEKIEKRLQAKMYEAVNSIKD